MVVAVLLVVAGAGGDDDASSGEPAGSGVTGSGSGIVEGCETDPAPMVVGGEPLAGTFSEATVTVRPTAGAPVRSCVLVADTAQERARGLMEVTDLGGYVGMLFVFDEEVDGAFHMQDTPTPLSIAWFAADGSLVSTEDMAPCLGEQAEAQQCPSHPADGPFRYALEVPQGGLAAAGVDGPDAVLVVGDG